MRVRPNRQRFSDTTWLHGAFKSPSAGGDQVGFCSGCKKTEGRTGQRAVCAAYQLCVMSSSTTGRPPVPAVRRCMTSSIAPQVLPSSAADASYNAYFVYGTEQGLTYALVQLCLLVKVMPRSARRRNATASLANMC